MPLTLTLLDAVFAVARLDPAAPLPTWTDAGGSFSSVTRTAQELSIVAEEQLVPADAHAERGFRAFRFEGPFAFSEVGILATVAGPLAAAGVSLLAIATFDTDYVLVNARDLSRALDALRAAGVVVRA